MHAWRTISLLIATIAIPLVVLADCPNQYEVLGDEGKAWLGMNAGGFVAGEGQSFNLECTSEILSVEFLLILDGLTWYGVPPLGTGDILYGEIMTTNGLTLATESITLDFDEGIQWITFDFTSHELELVGGEYLITCHPANAKQARMSYHQAEDIYGGGLRYISSNGGAGPWTPAAAEHGDLAFRVNTPGTVATESLQWGRVKTLYR
ncbi:hypothetical protein H8E07_05850 [bacterium]|nr:hypothetical protein [bacterium]